MRVIIIFKCWGKSCKSVDSILTGSVSFQGAFVRLCSCHIQRKPLLPNKLLGFQDRCIKPLCHPSGVEHCQYSTASKSVSAKQPERGQGCGIICGSAMSFSCVNIFFSRFFRMV